MNKIEDLVRARKTSLAKAEIKSFLKKESHKDQAVFMACDWYRRLGLYQEGLRLVLKTHPFETKISTQKNLGLSLLWSARLLNQLGASSYAYQILNYLKIDTLEGHHYAGSISLANYDFEKSLYHYSEFISGHTDKKSYSFRIASLGYADSLVQLEKYKEAITWAKNIYDQSSEDLLKGICLQACGEYLAQKEDYKEALDYIQQAEKYFPESDSSPDYSFLIKWKGYILCQMGKKAEGKKLFNEAVSLQKKMKIREEALFSTYNLMAKSKVLPAETEKLMINYPGLSPNLRQRLPTPKGPYHWGNSKAELKINLSSQEYQSKEQSYLGLPKEIELLALVRIVEDTGLNYLKAMAVLWPDEAFSFQSLPQRLTQLVHRLNHHYKIKINFKDNFLFIDKKDFSKVSVTTMDDIKPSFLKNKKSFTRLQVEEHYKLSKTNSNKQIKIWLEKSWIKSEGSARNLKYIC